MGHLENLVQILLISVERFSCLPYQLYCFLCTGVLSFPVLTLISPYPPNLYIKKGLLCSAV